MTSYWKTYHLKLKLLSPFLIPATQISHWGHDTSQMRNSENNPIIPGDLIKGLLRHSMRRIEHVTNTPDLVKSIFGQELVSKEHVRGRIIISDLVAISNDVTATTYTRVKIDTETGAAETGQLQTMELAYPPGQEVTFNGTLTICHPEQNEIQNLKKALQLIPAVGAHKSIGFGELIERSLQPYEENEAVVEITKQYDDVVEMSVKFDRPVLFDSERVAGNVFKSSEVIPGSVFKGALAAMLSKTGYLDGDAGTALNQIQFHFAYPYYQQQLYYPPVPLSLMVDPEAKEGTPRIFDAAQTSRPCTINGVIPVPLNKAKPRVQRAALKSLKRDFIPLPIEVRTRTSITHDRNTAESEALFSYATIQPTEIIWKAIIDRNQADPTEYKKLLDALATGLPRMGKTEAIATIQLNHVDENNPLRQQHKNIDKRHTQTILQLTTPALMIDPGINENPPQSLFEEYKTYWTNLDPQLKLKQFFTEEKLVGGFLAYKNRLRNNKNYHPYVLTEAGSVFVFEGDNASILKQYLSTGLELPKWVRESNSPPICCPFSPNNGYAAFLLNPTENLGLSTPDEIGVSYVK